MFLADPRRSTVELNPPKEGYQEKEHGVWSRLRSMRSVLGPSSLLLTLSLFRRGPLLRLTPNDYDLVVLVYDNNSHRNCTDGDIGRIHNTRSIYCKCIVNRGNASLKNNFRKFKLKRHTNGAGSVRLFTRIRRGLGTVHSLKVRSPPYLSFGSRFPLSNSLPVAYGPRLSERVIYVLGLRDAGLYIELLDRVPVS
jgi:hypothetical protein